MTPGFVTCLSIGVPMTDARELIDQRLPHTGIYDLIVVGKDMHFRRPAMIDVLIYNPLVVDHNEELSGVISDLKKKSNPMVFKIATC